MQSQQCRLLVCCKFLFTRSLLSLYISCFLLVTWMITMQSIPLMFSQLNMRQLNHKLYVCTGTEMAQLVCGGCHTLLMYIRGATSVQCSCCHTVNLALEGIELLMVSWACIMAVLKHVSYVSHIIVIWVPILCGSIICVLWQQIRWHMSIVGTAGCYSCTNMEQDPWNAQFAIL